MRTFLLGLSSKLFVTAFQVSVVIIVFYGVIFFKQSSSVVMREDVSSNAAEKVVADGAALFLGRLAVLQGSTNSPSKESLRFIQRALSEQCDEFGAGSDACEIQHKLHNVASSI